jgi:chromosome partitioning protein
MIIVCGGIKGGSGKTTAAVNLAIMRGTDFISLPNFSDRRRDVLLVDADDQETASDFSQLRSEKRGETGFTCIRLAGRAVWTEVVKLREKYDDIVIDTGGRDTTSQRAALTVADLLLVPFVPRSFDVWTLERVSKLVEEMQPANPQLRAATFLNRADARGQDNGEAADVLREASVGAGALEYSGISLGTRKAFANAAADGLAVSELKTPDLKALDEMRELYTWVFNGVCADGSLQVARPKVISKQNQFDIGESAALGSEFGNGHCA